MVSPHGPQACGAGSQRATLDGPTEAVEFIQWHPKGSVLLVGCEDMTAWMFNADKAQCMQVFSGHTGPVAAGACCAMPTLTSGVMPAPQHKIMHAVHVQGQSWQNHHNTMLSCIAAKCHAADALGKCWDGMQVVSHQMGALL